MNTDHSEALAEAKRRCPDYPWKENTMLEVVWALGEAYNGVKAALDDMRKINGHSSHGALIMELAEERARNEKLRKLLKALLWPNVPSASDVALMVRMCGTPKTQDAAMTLVDALRAAQDAARAALAETD